MSAGTKYGPLCKEQTQDTSEEAWEETGRAGTLKNKRIQNTMIIVFAEILIKMYLYLLHQGLTYIKVVRCKKFHATQAKSEVLHQMLGLQFIKDFIRQLQSSLIQLERNILINLKMILNRKSGTCHFQPPWNNSKLKKN